MEEEQQLNPHLFYEHVLETDCRLLVLAHAIVPTTFCSYLTRAREKTKADDVSRSYLLGVEEGNKAKKREMFYNTCAICCAMLRVRDRVPYQVALRIIGGLSPDDEWKYDLQLALLCNKCKTCNPYMSCWEIRDSDHDVVLKNISNHGFGKVLDMEPFIKSAKPGKELDALLEGYLARLDLVNEQAELIMTALMVGEDDDWVRCGYCLHYVQREFVTCCSDCRSVSFCHVLWNKMKGGGGKSSIKGLTCLEVSTRLVCCFFLFVFFLN
jgi:hypothetical protein